MSNQPRWDGWNEAGGPRYPHAKAIQFCLRHFSRDIRHITRALDLGCGSGVNTRLLAETGFPVWATDISPVGIANTRRLLQAHGLQAECHVAPVDQQPFLDGSFDLILCIGVFDSAGPQAAHGAMAEVRRLLRPLGRALLVFASDEDMRVGNGTPYGLTGYKKNEVDALVEGFTQASIDRYITTYDGGTFQHNDFLVTLIR